MRAGAHERAASADRIKRAPMRATAARSARQAAHRAVRPTASASARFRHAPPAPDLPSRVVLFPGTPLPLHIFEPRYRRMLADCLAGDRRFGITPTGAERRGARPGHGRAAPPRCG